MTDFFEVMKFTAMDGIMLFGAGVCIGGLLTVPLWKNQGTGTWKWGFAVLGLGAIGFFVWRIFSYNPIAGGG